MEKPVDTTRILDDKSDDPELKGPSQLVSITGTPDALEIRPKGFGEAAAQDGYGVPVFIELYEGSLRLIVWGDINQQDPTHIIRLEGALESRRGQPMIANNMTSEFGPPKPDSDA
jgi:hypothetical protein